MRVRMLPAIQRGSRAMSPIHEKKTLFVYAVALYSTVS